MVKVLLLDDETLALEYLETIVNWQRHGFEVIGQYTDAKQALKVFRRERPELIISDIYMVGMDGIDFVSAVREIDQSVHILFLSGYKNFEYVQSAIRLGIDDYLLKSDVNEKAFLSKLLQIKEKIERERQKTRYTVNTVLREIFEKDTEEKRYRNILSEAQYDWLQKRYYYLISSVKHCPGFIIDCIPELNDNCYLEDAHVSHHVLKAAEQCGMQAVTSFRLYDVHMLSVLDKKPGISCDYGRREYLNRFAQQVSACLNAAGTQSYDVIYTAECYTIREFGRIYAGTKEQLNRVFLHKEPLVLKYDGAYCSRASSVMPRNACDKLCAAIAKGDHTYPDELIARIRAALGQQDYHTYLKLMRTLFEAFSRMEDDGEKSLEGSYFSVIEGSQAYDFFSAEDVVRFAAFKVEAALNLFQRGQENHYSKSIQDAIACIQKRYGEEELGTSMVARYVNLSPSWLSTKFKEEVGIGISEYLNSVRIQRARELLQSGDCMIYEVSEQVGFASSQYFSKIFKQITGMTPNEYRRKSKNKQRK